MTTAGLGLQPHIYCFQCIDAYSRQPIFYRAMLCIARTMLPQDVCLSVCPSVCHMPVLCRNG